MPTKKPPAPVHFAPGDDPALLPAEFTFDLPAPAEGIWDTDAFADQVGKPTMAGGERMLILGVTVAPDGSSARFHVRRLHQ